MKRLFVALMFVVGMALGAGCSHISLPGPKPSPELFASWNFGPKPQDPEKILRNYLHNILFDPYSAKISIDKNYIVKSWQYENSKYIYGWGGTALINAKNRFGAYIGDTEYNFLIRNNEVIWLRYEK